MFSAGAHTERASEPGAGARRPADQGGEGKGEDEEKEGSHGRRRFGRGRGKQHVQKTQLENEKQTQQE